MSDQTLLNQVLLSNEAGEEIARQTVAVTLNTPGIYNFENLSAGMYIVTIIPPKNVAVISENPRTDCLVYGDSICREIAFYIDPKILASSTSKSPSLFGCITIPSISITLMAMIEPSFVPGFFQTQSSNTKTSYPDKA